MEVRNLIEWSDEELSVGVQEIDEQHKILVELVNRMYRSIITRHDDEELKKILNELAQYTAIHFAVEESLMRIFDYPDYEEHKQHHHELTDQVVTLKQKVEAGESKISMEVLNFLRHWLTHHIQGEDKRYGPFLLERGLKGTWAKRTWAGKIWNVMHHS